MKLKFKELATLGLIAAATMLAQGPPPGGPGFGGRGRGPGFGGPGGPGGGGAGAFMRGNVKNAPFSGVETTTTTQSLADGTTITRTNTRTISRDSQGRVRIETTHTPPGGGATAQARTSVEIYDPVAGTVSRLDPQRQVADTEHFRQPPADSANARGPRARGGAGGPRANGRPAPADAPQITRSDLGTQMIGGVSATGSRTSHTVAAGADGNSKAITSTREVWVSAELGIPVSETSSDPRFGTTTRTMTNLTRSEPDAALFQVPSGYSVAKGHGRPGPPR